MTTEIKQRGGSNNYFRHFITDTKSDLSLSMTVYSGAPEMFIAIDP